MVNVLCPECILIEKNKFISIEITGKQKILMCHECGWMNNTSDHDCRQHQQVVQCDQSETDIVECLIRGSQWITLCSK